MKHITSTHFSSRNAFVIAARNFDAGDVQSLIDVYKVFHTLVPDQWYMYGIIIELIDHPFQRENGALQSPSDVRLRSKG